MRIKHDDKLAPNSDAHFQVALLYTNVFGERRIRVHSLSLRVTDQLGDVFRGADMDALGNALVKMAIQNATALSLQEIREKITNQCVTALTAYRKLCTQPNTGAGQVRLFNIYWDSRKLTPIGS